MEAPNPNQKILMQVCVRAVTARKKARGPTYEFGNRPLDELSNNFIKTRA